MVGGGKLSFKINKLSNYKAVINLLKNYNKNIENFILSPVG